jgi:hypothetical protein
LINLQIDQNIQITVNGQDAAGNPAPVSVAGFTINDHSKAYAAQKDAATVWVVARGPMGNFQLAVTGNNAGGGSLTSTLDFTVVAGNATQVLLTPAAPAGWFPGVPDLPTGW